MLQLDGVVICGCTAPVILDRASPARGGPRLPTPSWPTTHERQYRVALAPIVADLRERTADFAAALGDFAVEDAARMTRARAVALREKLAAMREAVLERWTREQIVRQIPVADIVEGVDAMQRRATFAQLTKAIELSPLDVPADAVALIKAADGEFSAAARDRWTRANAGLIRSMARDHLDSVAEAVDDTVRHGRRASLLAETLRERTGISARKAKLIARDQIASLQGQVTQARQTKLGIERYRWRTAGDTRVRTEHAMREGQIFSWDRPPPDGHPGQPINCRCYAEPVIEDVLKGLTRPE